MNEKTYTIDAKGKRLGRVASEAATILMGKDSPAYARHKEGEGKVVIENAGALSIDENKRKDKAYYSYSGYPGNQKKEVLKDLIAKKGGKELLIRAISGMLPKNKLRDRMLKRLLINEK